MASLYPYQADAVARMHNGCILCGGVGSGKSRTSLAYYFTKECGGSLEDEAAPKSGPPLYIITTARKRDTGEWAEECSAFPLPSGVTIDSWNNISKYSKVTGAFFIFDEQRVVGSGAWVRSFLKIARGNRWILLSATPGDTWLDYVPVFIANGYYRNRSDFTDQHVVYSRFSKYPRVDRYVSTGRLNRIRRELLVNMDYQKTTISVHEEVRTDYDRNLFKHTLVDRWDIANDKPLQDASALCYALRRVVNSDPDRLYKLGTILEKHPKIIVFYNFNYELDMIRAWADARGLTYSEWNGQNHDPLPECDSWLYLVQYTAGAEGWNCVTTDTMVFFSQNYSYKTMVQAAGRIDRLNTPYTSLYYYRFVSASPIDLAIKKALLNKKNFNETKFVGGS